MTITERARAVLTGVADMLDSKNQQYGNSASEPMRVFSRASAEEGILVRIDDKLSRIARGRNDHEDTVRDLIGYLALLVALREERTAKDEDAIGESIAIGPQRLMIDGETWDHRTGEIVQSPLAISSKPANACGPMTVVGSDGSKTYVDADGNKSSDPTSISEAGFAVVYP
jgi:hypothetical protein